MDNWILVWSLLPLYTIVYILIGFFFNWKILYVSQKKWKLVVITSAITEFMFAGSLILAAFISTGNWEVGYQIGYIFATAGMMALGSGISAYIVGRISDKKEKMSKEITIEDRIITLEKEILKLKNGK